ncbi:hypothetical protein QFZ75_001623 [Streptomyces sp. V3I8]|nr:hypothetical protein [Streptomyces sp. V3I8]
MSCPSRSQVPATDVPRRSRYAARMGCPGTPAGPDGACALDAGSGARSWAAAVRPLPTARRRLPTASAVPPRTPTSSILERSNHLEDHGIRLGADLPAAPRTVAADRSLRPTAPHPARQTARGRRTGLVRGMRRRLPRPRQKRGADTGPSPAERRKTGSRHHLIRDGHGTPPRSSPPRQASTTSPGPSPWSTASRPSPAARAGPAAAPRPSSETRAPPTGPPGKPVADLHGVCRGVCRGTSRGRQPDRRS